MKKSVFTFIFLSITFFSIGQSLEWVSSFGSSNYDRIWDAANFGNKTVTVGIFSGTLNYNPSTTITSPVHNGGIDVLLNIYDSLGQLTVSKAFGGSSVEISKKLAIDNSGNIYLVGAFSNTVEFDRSRTGLFAKTSNGGQDAFLAKFDANGNLIWVNTIGGSGNDEALSIGINSLNEIIITGYYKGIVDFDPSPAVLNSSSTSNSTDIFLAKFSSSGSLIWNKTFGSTSSLEASREIAIDQNDNIILVGFYGGTMDIDPSTSVFNLSHGSQENSFIGKFDNQGNLITAKNLTSSSELIVKSVKLSSTNEIILAGSFYGSADFNPSNSSTAFASSNGSSDGFLIKLDSNMNFIFVKTIGSASADVMEKIELDDNNNIYCTGYYFGTMDFDPSPNSTATRSNGGSSDAYLLKLDNNGNFQWVTTISGSVSDIGLNMICDQQNVYLVGNASSPADFDPSAAVQGVPFFGSSDGFIVKYNDCQQSDSSIFEVACAAYISPSGRYTWTTSGNYTDTLQTKNGCDSVITISLFVTNQNKTVTQNGFTLTSNATNSTFQWLDCSNGNTAISGETNASFTATQNGDYAVELTQNGCKDTSACITILGVGLESNQFTNQTIILSPNPTNGNFNIQFESNFSGVIEIYNSVGQSVYNNMVNDSQIDVSLDVSKGIYLVRLTNEEGKISTAKLLVK